MGLGSSRSSQEFVIVHEITYNFVDKILRYENDLFIFLSFHQNTIVKALCAIIGLPKLEVS